MAIPWLADTYRAEIVTVTMDLGQGTALDDVRDRALAGGAVRAHVLDLREEFARGFILPALQAGAIDDRRDPLAPALGRPLIAKHLVELARIEGAAAIAHGCTGHDQIRMEALVRALEPSIQVIALASVRDFSRPEPVEYRTDTNLWGRAIACGVQDPWQELPEDAYLLSRPPAEAPDIPAAVDIEFEGGVPVKVNGVAMPLVELIQSLETIAGAHGVGRLERVERRRGGLRLEAPDVHEAPAAVALHRAHAALQRLVTPRDLERLATELGGKYADLIDNGQWYTPTREAIDALVAQVQKTVTGTVRLKFFKGDCRVIGSTSPFALSDRAPATYDEGGSYKEARNEGSSTHRRGIRGSRGVGMRGSPGRDRVGGR